MYTTLVTFHLLAAAVWVGGTVTLVFAAVPVLRRLPVEHRAAGMRALGRRWRPIGWTALAVLLASGAWLAFGYWGADSSYVLLHTEDGHVLIAKAVLFLSVVVTSALHDFVLGPALNRQIQGRHPQTLRTPMRVVGWITFAATIALPVLGVVLST